MASAVFDFAAIRNALDRLRGRAPSGRRFEPDGRPEAPKMALPKPVKNNRPDNWRKRQAGIAKDILDAARSGGRRE